MSGRGPRRPALRPAPVFDLALLTDALCSVGGTAEHARAVHAHALRHPRSGWGAIKGYNLPKAALEVLDSDFTRTSSTVAERRESVDGTVKMLIRLQDGLEVETVVIPMSAAYSTVCVSSQVGCAMGCTFCATGSMGLKGNLAAGEIVEQIVHARDACPGRNVRNVVFMGMGEPLHNYDAVLAAVRTLTDPKTFGMPRHSITVSTVGVVGGIRNLARDAPWVRLAFSLHNPDQEQRQTIVPSASRFPLTDILAALDAYLAAGEAQQVMIEFCVLRGKNDTPADARRIGELLHGRSAIVNLIPYNPTDVTDAFQVPSNDAVLAMRRVLTDEFGHLTTIRRAHGRDIGGACGQLALQRAGGRVLDAPADIEDAAGGGGGAGGGGTGRGRFAEQLRLAESLSEVAAAQRKGALRRCAPVAAPALLLLVALAATQWCTALHALPLPV